MPEVLENSYLNGEKIIPMVRRESYSLSVELLVGINAYEIMHRIVRGDK
jgi:hypothetical protein